MNLKINLSEKLKVHGLFGLRKTGKTHEKYMRGDRPPNINYAERFIKYGDLDYKAAELLFDVQDLPYDFMNQAAFLCAQAVEKYLKAFLFWNASSLYPGLSGKQVSEKFKSVGLGHNLVAILDECVKSNEKLDNFRKQVAAINKYSLLKYPDEEDKLIFSDEGLTISSEILRDVKSIGDFVKHCLSRVI